MSGTRSTSCCPWVGSGRQPSAGVVLSAEDRRDERTVYRALDTYAYGERGNTYGARALRCRSDRSTPRWGKPSTWGRVTGGGIEPNRRINARCVLLILFFQSFDNVARSE